MGLKSKHNYMRLGVEVSTWGIILAFKKFQSLEDLGFQISRLGVVDLYVFKDHNQGMK